MKQIALFLGFIAQFSLAETPQGIATVQNAVAALSERPGMESARVGVALLRLGDDPEVIVDVDGKKSFIPASTTKILTSVAALDALGPDFTFETLLGYSGTLTEGSLTGDLVIRGTGDPTLAEYGWDDLFEKWTALVKATGIAKIEGRVIGDASFYSGPPRSGSWTWQDLGNYYASGAQGLNFFNNTFLIRFLPSREGSLATFLGTTPELPGVRFYNEMQTGSADSGDQGYVYAAPYGSVAHFRGSVPKGGTFTIKGALPEPALTCAHLFHAHLQKQGITITQEPDTRRNVAPNGGTVTTLTKEMSAPLDNLLQRMNFKSINLFAETLLRRTGKATNGDGSIDSGIKAIEAYFGKHGIATTGFSMHDGAGLSPLNTITPRQMIYILKAAQDGPHGDVFRKSLPIAGQNGTLKGVAVGTAAAGRVRAKSGTLSRTKCYAGYIDARSGASYAFAIMVNQYAKNYSDVKPGIEAIMARMAEL